MWLLQGVFSARPRLVPVPRGRPPGSLPTTCICQKVRPPASSPKASIFRRPETARGMARTRERARESSSLLFECRVNLCNQDRYTTQGLFTTAQDFNFVHTLKLEVTQDPNLASSFHPDLRRQGKEFRVSGFRLTSTGDVSAWIQTVRLQEAEHRGMRGKGKGRSLMLQSRTVEGSDHTVAAQTLHRRPTSSHPEPPLAFPHLQIRLRFIL